MRNGIGFEHNFVVDSKGIRGGLTFLWKDHINAALDSYTHSHISLRVTNPGRGKNWLLTSFYGNPLTAKRIFGGKLIRALKPDMGVAWLGIEDFNEILHHSEKHGVAVRPFRQLGAFREATEESGLNDLGYIGNKYTWSNNREGKNFNKERLDRGFGNSAWHDMQSATYVRTLAGQSSDHFPLLIRMQNNWFGDRKEKKLFHYETTWAQREECHVIIKEMWKTKPTIVTNKSMATTVGL